MSAEMKHVFVVDDDGSVCRALGVLLGAYGFTVDAYASAEEFFRAVPNSAPGCLILDIHMPGLEGWETLRHLNASGSVRPVIMISADKKKENHERALKAGVVGFLRKPFNDQTLVGLINTAFEKMEAA